jgi:hypothetical protein
MNRRTLTKRKRKEEISKERPKEKTCINKEREIKTDKERHNKDRQ